MSESTEELINRIMRGELLDVEDFDPLPDVTFAEVASETIARILLNQRLYEEAASVFLALAARDASRRDEFIKRAAEAHSRGRSHPPSTARS